MLKKYLKKIIYGHKYDSEAFIRYLNGKGADIAEDVYFVAPPKTLIDETRPYLIQIGNRVTITEGCKILTHGFDWSVLKVLYGDVIGSGRKVSIEDNCFIGVNTIILGGVTIGKNTIIGAGSVVTRDIPADSVAAGNPCKVICSIKEYYNKRKIEEMEEALDIIRQYYQRYRKFPSKEEMAEFFMLFANDEDLLIDEIARKVEYGENAALAKDMLHKKADKFASFEAMCEAAIGRSVSRK